MLLPADNQSFLTLDEIYERCPYYKSVPKDYVGNLEYRRKILRWGYKNSENAAALWQACSRDILFYINTFAWTYNPRDHKDCPHRPFITWPMQDDALLRICDAIEDNRDVVAFKSRQLGMTWICLLPLEWRWHFRNGQSFLLVARIEEDVDKPNKPKSLFWKLDYLHARMPRWLLPAGRWLGKDDPNRNKNLLRNADYDSVFNGSATVPDLGRGDVLTAILLDEAASMEKADEISSATRNATRTRIWNSTPKGTRGKGQVFYEQAMNANNVRVKLHWSQHPEKAAGLYVVDHNGQVVVVDPIHNPLPPGYIKKADAIHRTLRERGFIIEGKLRSPYYDEECLRAKDESEIRQEEDIDFLSAGLPYFNPVAMEKAKSFCRDPLHVGFFSYDQEILRPKWEENSGGRWKLWVPLDRQTLTPPPGRYIIGADIASGQGGTSASNSVLCVINEVTGEQVAEFAYNLILPDALARLAVAACRFFHDGERGAKLNWETNGPGGGFGDWIIKRIRYRNIARRPKLGEFGNETGKDYGWGNTPQTREPFFGDLRGALTTGDFLARSAALIEECNQYQQDGSGKVYHVAITGDNEADQEGQHGDRVIAAGVAWIARPNRAVVRDKTVKPTPTVALPGSIAYRRQQRELASR